MTKKSNRTIRVMTAAAMAASVAVASIGFSTQANAASATFDASANIQTAIQITNAANLNFANIVPSSSAAGTVLINTSGGRTCDPALSCAGTTAAAEFDVIGSDGATYSITLPSAANIASGPNNMLVDGFVSSVGAVGTLTGGSETFNVGGTLNVGINQAVGAYTGTFSVTVEYN